MQDTPKTAAKVNKKVMALAIVSVFNVLVLGMASVAYVRQGRSAKDASLRADELSYEMEQIRQRVVELENSSKKAAER